MCFKYKDLEKSDVVADEGVITVRIEKLKVNLEVNKQNVNKENVINKQNLIICFYSLNVDDIKNFKSLNFKGT